ncbi:nucleolar protein [Exophiala oligosperma]
MATKKRKESSGAGEVPHKKSKKSKSTAADNATISSATIPVADAPVAKSKTNAPSNAAAVSAKSSRKRAADFMEDGEDAPGKAVTATKSAVDLTTAPTDKSTSKKTKKAKKSNKGKHDELLSADGVNGIIEHSGEEEVETATTHKPVSTSMQAEAEHTVDHELQDEYGSAGDDDEAEQDDNAAVLLAGFDSESEDNQEDKGLDVNSKPTIPANKKLRSQLKKIKNSEGADEEPGTVYVGRIPHGFYEAQMKEYFSQFGDISRLRLSRNKRTGASKHFAFIEFKSNEVAKIVASTMDNYLLFGHILKCKYAEPGSLHPDVWKGADKKFRRIPHEKLEREKLAAPKTEAQWQRLIKKEQNRRDKKARKLQKLGIDMPSSTLTDPSKALRERLAVQEQQQQLQDEISVPTGMLEPPKNVPKDAVAVKEAKKSKKEKKPEKVASAAVEDEPSTTTSKKDVTGKSSKKDKKSKQVDITPAEAQAKTVTETTTDEVTVPEATEAKPAKKDKKKKQKSDSAEQVEAHTSVAIPEKKLSKKEKQAQKKSQEASVAVEEAAEPAVEPPVSSEAAPAESGADFISLAEFADEQADSGDDSGANEQAGKPGKLAKPWKKEKKKKDRKNLVKARGPKSNLVPTSQKSRQEPQASGKDGMPLMGKSKYDKAARRAHKEMKKEMLSKKFSGQRRLSSGSS